MRILNAEKPVHKLGSTYSRRLVWRCRWDRRRRQRRECRRRSWMFVAVQSRSRTRPDQTFDVPGRSLSHEPAARCSSWDVAESCLQSVVLAAWPSLLRTWWQGGFLDWLKCRQQLVVCEVVSAATTWRELQLNEPFVSLVSATDCNLSAILVVSS